MRLLCIFFLLGEISGFALGATTESQLCGGAFYYVPKDFPLSIYAPDPEVEKKLTNAPDRKRFAKDQAISANRVTRQVHRGKKAQAIFEAENALRLSGKPGDPWGKARVGDAFDAVDPPRHPDQLAWLETKPFEPISEEIREALHFWTSEFTPVSPGVISAEVRERLQPIRDRLFPDWTIEDVNVLRAAVLNPFIRSDGVWRQRVKLSDGRVVTGTLVIRGQGLVLGFKKANYFWYHPWDPRLLLQDVFDRLDRLVAHPPGRDELAKEFAAATDEYYIAMPLGRGSAGRGNFYLAGYFRALTKRKLPFVDGIDRSSMSMDQDQFVDWYSKQIAQSLP